MFKYQELIDLLPAEKVNAAIKRMADCYDLTGNFFEKEDNRVYYVLNGERLLKNYFELSSEFISLLDNYAQKEYDEELKKKFDEADWIEENDARDKAEIELAAALPVTSEEDLRIYYPAQEVLDSWAGMTGQELQDAGFEINGYNVDDAGEYMEISKGMLVYRVETNEAYGDFYK